MPSTNYRRYINQTLALARSMTIKSQAIIDGMNTQLTLANRQVLDDPKTWRYYRHVSGQYHPEDTPMMITSLDTQQQVEFSRDTLNEHIATRLNYVPGSRYYEALVARFPKQEQLIRGIVDPVPIAQAIAAPDFAVLNWDDSLVESNEHSLIQDLQERIYKFTTRWHNPNYGFVDELYATAHFAILHHQLPLWLLNIRLSYCKTRYAHSFHILEFLHSHNKLDRFGDFLTKAQMLFLYRNIVYIENNAGQQQTFDWLAEKLFTDRGIGLADYSIRHNIDAMPDEAIKPSVEFRRRRLNQYHASTRTDEHTLAQLLAKERPLALRNADVETETISQDEPKIINAQRDHFPTKVVESALIDWSESGVVTKTRFLIHHWAYWGSTQRYRAVIRFSHPRSGRRITLSPNDAFILYFYTYNRSLGFTPKRVTDVPVSTIRRYPTPSYDTLAALVDKRYVDAQTIREISNLRETDEGYYSIVEFVEAVQARLRQYTQYRTAIGVQEHMRARAMVEAAINHLYMHTDTQFDAAGQSYEQWLYERGLEFVDLQTTEYEVVSQELLEIATGIRLTSTQSAESVQKAMVELMRELSSYSVQFTREFNRGPILFWSWPATRVGDIDFSAMRLMRFHIGLPSYETVKASARHIHDIKTTGVIRSVRFKHAQRIKYDMSTFGLTAGALKHHVRMPMARPQMKVLSE